MAGTGQPKTGGRKSGTANKLTRELREMIRQALDEEGGVEYLRWAARNQPNAFLSLVGRLVPAEIHNGRLDVDSVEGVGSKFSLILPVK